MLVVKVKFDEDDETIKLKDNQNLVHHVLKEMNFRATHPAYEDLYQEGMFGLLSAIRNFDSTSGYRFSTFAYRCIKNAILNYLEDNPMDNVIENTMFISFDTPIIIDGENEITLLDLYVDEE